MLAAIHHPDGSTDFVTTQELKGWMLYAGNGYSGLYRVIPNTPDLTYVPNRGPVPKDNPEIERGVR